MASQSISNVENNFTKGLLTEFTGMNFPENAATDADNCIFTLIGDVVRREGIDYEANATLNPISLLADAVNTYKWNNAGGDGETQVIVTQSNGALVFYQSSSATAASPLSAQLLDSTVGIGNFVAGGNIFDPTIECQFTDGNGYLFVYHPNCDPFYCTYNAGVITGNVISLQIRDFAGIVETGVGVSTRPGVPLSAEHQYNLSNQGWTSGNPWFGQAFSVTSVGLGPRTFNIQTGLTIANGTNVNISIGTVIGQIGVPIYPSGELVMAGSVTSYNSSNGGLVVNVYALSAVGNSLINNAYSAWNVTPSDIGFINTWFAAIGNYPSNADVWWYFKDDTNTFNPAVTNASVSLSTGNAPQGHYLYNPFSINRSATAGISGLTSIITSARPSNGAWFQGRVWYTGVNAQQASKGDAAYTTWTENIYFSQVVQGVADFGSCYQTNDPTSENLFDLLPTDGGVIQIQGAGSIYKLFPIQNGMLVFAANGVWYITGSQGIGFSANDYTITKISSVASISSTSFVDVLGLPYFWNEEGIYNVANQQGGGLTVNALTVGTIETFYDNIPRQCKQYVRGAYHPINYVIQWIYNDTPDNGSITARYSFNNILNYNVYNKAFYTYSIADGTPAIAGINYVSSPGGSAAPDPVFKYYTSALGLTTFSEENNSSYVDWQTFDGVGLNFESFFVTGYKLHGQGQRRFQINYIYTFHRNAVASSIYLQGIWDYANTGNSGRWSTKQLINNWNPNFDFIIRRHKIRGQGLVLQLRFSSLDGQPFDVMGWSVIEQQNTGA